MARSTLTSSYATYVTEIKEADCDVMRTEDRSWHSVFCLTVCRRSLFCRFWVGNCLVSALFLFRLGWWCWVWLVSSLFVLFWLYLLLVWCLGMWLPCALFTCRCSVRFLDLCSAQFLCWLCFCWYFGSCFWWCLVHLDRWMDYVKVRTGSLLQPSQATALHVFTIHFRQVQTWNDLAKAIEASDGKKTFFFGWSFFLPAVAPPSSLRRW